MNKLKPGSAKPLSIDEIFEQFCHTIAGGPINDTTDNNNDTNNDGNGGDGSDRVVKRQAPHEAERTFSFKYYYVDPEQFDPIWNYDFTSILSEPPTNVRGKEIYKRPIGSKRYAIKVLGKYPPNDKWLGMTGYDEEEWPVSYHGTKEFNVESIIINGLRVGPEARFGYGVYSSPEPKVALLTYASPYDFEEKTYKLIFQTRINPKLIKKIPQSETWDYGDYWLLPAENYDKTNIRPYGICVFPCGNERNFC